MYNNNEGVNMMELIALIISILSFISSVLIYFFGILRQKKQDTINAFNTIQNQVLDEMTKHTKKELSTIAQNTRSEEYKNMSVLLARCEHFAVGVNSGIYDIRIVKRLAGRYFIGLYEKFLPLIEEKRRICPTDRHYDEFEKMIHKLKKYYKER